MSLADTLRLTLQPVLAGVIGDFGSTFVARRKRPVLEANGTTSIEWVAIEGVGTFSGVFETLTEELATRTYGRDLAAVASLLLQDTVAIELGDRVILQSGVLAGTAYDVVHRAPTDAGGVVSYALAGVPAGVDYGL